MFVNWAAAAFVVAVAMMTRPSALAAMRASTTVFPVPYAAWMANKGQSWPPARTARVWFGRRVISRPPTDVVMRLEVHWVLFMRVRVAGTGGIHVEITTAAWVEAQL